MFRFLNLANEKQNCNYNKSKNSLHFFRQPWFLIYNWWKVPSNQKWLKWIFVSWHIHCTHISQCGKICWYEQLPSQPLKETRLNFRSCEKRGNRYKWKIIIVGRESRTDWYPASSIIFSVDSSLRGHRNINGVHSSIGLFNS